MLHFKILDCNTKTHTKDMVFTLNQLLLNVPRPFNLGSTACIDTYVLSHDFIMVTVMGLYSLDSCPWARYRNHALQTSIFEKLSHRGYSNQVVTFAHHVGRGRGGVSEGGL